MKDFADVVDVLPDTLSGMIRVALEDEEKLYQLPADYQIMMSEWHVGGAGGFIKCEVCLAGCVMACRLKVGIGTTARPGDFKREIDKKLLAINWLRRGRVDLAAREMRSLAVGFNQEITRYEVSRERFRADMTKLASDLEAAGY